MKAVMESIIGANTEEEVFSLLEGKSKTELLAIAYGLSAFPSKKTIPDIKEAIVRCTVRAKHRTKVIRGY